MSDQALADFSADSDDEGAEWRPYQVWASQMRSADNARRRAGATNSSDAHSAGWDPYTVWKQQVQQGDTPKSSD